MTISLAIDTATARTIVGIIEDGQILFSQFHDGATDHGRAVADLVAKALQVAKPPQQVVVGMGPGPFTGLRVGIAFAQTFALARQIPLIGVCSLDAITIAESHYTVAIDARRKEIYWASYQDGVRIAGPAVNKLEEVANFILGQFPDVKRMVELSADQDIGEPDIREPIYLRRPDAVPTAERK